MAKQEEIKTIVIDGVEFIRKDQTTQKAEPLDGMEYCIIRTYSAGVFAGYVKSRVGKEVELLQSRRLWYWKGAASLSQLSVDGVSKPNECKFPVVVERIFLTEAVEILPCTAKAKLSIDSVPIWKA